MEKDRTKTQTKGLSDMTETQCKQCWFDYVFFGTLYKCRRPTEENCIHKTIHVSNQAWRNFRR